MPSSTGGTIASYEHLIEEGSGEYTRLRAIIYDKNDGILYYNADGSGAGEAVAFARISKNLALRFQDIVVI